MTNFRPDFPLLSREVHGRPLVYLDNAATTQKPRAVLEAMDGLYTTCNANVHRGIHTLSQEATALHEAARERVRAFLNARSTAEIIFTRGTTESLNLVASSFAEAFLHEGDEVILTVMEHHSDIVPWQLARDRRGFTLRVVPMDDEGRLDLEAYAALLNERTRLVCCCHVSNVLGTVNPVREMARMAHDAGAYFLVDGAQSVPHFPVDVQELDCDFLAFSAHKLYGPTGVGPTKISSHVTPWRACVRSKACGFSAQWRGKPQSFRSTWAKFTRWIWAHCSTIWVLPSAPATIARNRSWPVAGSKAWPACRLPSTTPSKRSIASWKRCNAWCACSDAPFGA